MSFLHQTVQCNFAEVDSDYLLKACPTDHCTNGTHHCVVTGRTDAARTRLDERVSACVWHTHNTKILCKVADTLIVITEVQYTLAPNARPVPRSRHTRQCFASHTRQVKSQNEQCYVRRMGLLAAGCVATAAARLVAMEAPAPPCAASLNARHSVEAGSNCSRPAA